VNYNVVKLIERAEEMKKEEEEEFESNFKEACEALKECIEVLENPEADQKAQDEKINEAKSSLAYLDLTSNRSVSIENLERVIERLKLLDDEAIDLSNPTGQQIALHLKL